MNKMRVLIVRTSALGDVVQGIDAFSSLKAMKTPIHWGWVVSEPFLPLVEGVEGIDEILVVPRKWSFSSWWKFRKQHLGQSWDLIIDLQGLLKSYLVTLALKHGEMVTWGPKHCRDRLVPYLATRVYDESWVSSRDSYRKLIQFALGKNLIEIEHEHKKPNFPDAVNHIVCSPCSVWPTKRIGFDAWGKLLKAMRADYPEAKISMIAGNENERNWVLQGIDQWQDEDTSLVPAMNLTELKEFFKSCQIYIGMDSGPSHMASSLGLPTLIFYGPSLPETYDQFGVGPHAPRGDCHLNEVFEQRCDKLRVCEKCSAIESIDIEQAWDEFIKDLSSRRSSAL